MTDPQTTFNAVPTGPMVQVTTQPQLTICTGRPASRWPDHMVWQGKVLLYLDGDPLMEMEAQLIKSTRGDGDDFVSLPQRQYDANGVRKYAKLVYTYDKGLLPAIKEAIIKHLNQNDDRPF